MIVLGIIEGIITELDDANILALAEKNIWLAKKEPKHFKNKKFTAVNAITYNLIEYLYNIGVSEYNKLISRKNKKNANTLDKIRNLVRKDKITDDEKPDYNVNKYIDGLDKKLGNSECMKTFALTISEETGTSYSNGLLVVKAKDFDEAIKLITKEIEEGNLLYITAEYTRENLRELKDNEIVFVYERS